MLRQKIELRSGSIMRIGAVLVLAALVALPASAVIFTVTLSNGATIDTRYRPMQASTDESKIQLFTEHGNWITLPKSIVVSIESDFEARGYGTVLDTDTVILGYSINDLPDPSQQAPPSAAEQLFELLRGPQQDPFTVEQFVEPNSAGGIPIGFTSRTTPPLGSPTNNRVPIAGENN